MEDRRFNSALNRTKAIGRKQTLIEGHIYKTVYREGEGECPNPKLYPVFTCSLKCFLMNGNMVYERKTIEYTLGNDRLIEGLQIALSSSRLNQKFTVIISPEYAYKYNDVVTDNMVPTNEKLVFQIDVLNLQIVELNRKNFVDLITISDRLYEKAEYYLSINKHEKAIKILQHIFFGMRDKKVLHLRQIVTVKWAEILQQQDRNEDALKILQICYENNQHFQPCYMLEIKIYKKLKMADEVKRKIEEYYQAFRRNVRRKRKYIDMLKEIKDYKTLQTIPYYDLQKDLVLEEQEREYYRHGMPLFYGFGF